MLNMLSTQGEEREVFELKRPGSKNQLQFQHLVANYFWRNISHLLNVNILSHDKLEGFPELKTCFSQDKSVSHEMNTSGEGTVSKKQEGKVKRI